jgi:hypothetical protein
MDAVQSAPLDPVAHEVVDAGQCKKKDCNGQVRVSDRNAGLHPPDYCFLHNPCRFCGRYTAWKTLQCYVCDDEHRTRSLALWSFK